MTKKDWIVSGLCVLATFAVLGVVVLQVRQSDVLGAICALGFACIPAVTAVANILVPIKMERM